jgi:hypothetical protein
MFLAQRMQTGRSWDILSVTEAFSINVKKKEWVLYHKLLHLYSLLATALKSSYHAQCIKCFTKNTYSSDNFTKKNYKKLSSIDFCWRALDWLKKYYTTNYNCIPLLFAVKKGNAADVSNFVETGMVITKNIINEVKDNSLVSKELLQKFYDKQECCVCLEHPEDMRDIPCKNQHVNNFICRQCYNNLLCDTSNQRMCPLCRIGCFSYDTVTHSVVVTNLNKMVEFL